MDCDFIGKRDDPQEASLQLTDFSPKPISILLLRLDSNRRFNDTDANVLRYVWPLSHHLIFEVQRKRVRWRACSLSKGVGPKSTPKGEVCRRLNSLGGSTGNK